MTSRSIMATVACLAVLAGCQTNKKKDTTTARAEQERQEQRQEEEGQTLGEFGEDTAEATRDAADATLRGIEEAEETIARGEDLPPEPGVDMPPEGEETPGPGEKDVITGETDPEPDLAVGTELVARFDRVDEKKRRVIFRVQEAKEDIELQAGKELHMSFADLALLTGMEKDEAISKLEKASDLKVRVIGVGDAMRIVNIDMPENEGMPMEEPVKDTTGGATEDKY